MEMSQNGKKLSEEDIKYGGGRYICSKCGVTHVGSTIHHCEESTHHLIWSSLEDLTEEQREALYKHKIISIEELMKKKEDIVRN